MDGFNNCFGSRVKDPKLPNAKLLVQRKKREYSSNREKSDDLLSNC